MRKSKCRGCAEGDFRGNMLTRSKQAFRALPAVISDPEEAKNRKEEGASCGDVFHLEVRELLDKIEGIRFHSGENGVGSEEDSNGFTKEENEDEECTMSACSEVSAMDQSTDDENSVNMDDNKEVAPPVKSSLPDLDALIAEKMVSAIKDGDFKKLTVDTCRSYLRAHGLRISGNKPVLIDRIKQHIELKEGIPQRYLENTFTVNCTGDVCKGDVIKFKQKVHNKFNVQRRGADAVGVRDVIGRVVKESYGEKKQQHTFTVEVLWSAGYKPLSPMHQLLVKGRNLYRLRTYRQKWDDENLRKTSLDEKHERGAAARTKRRETLRASGKQSKTRNGALKQIPNPYVVTNPSSDVTKMPLKERSNNVPHHRNWFPKYQLDGGQCISSSGNLRASETFSAARENSSQYRDLKKSTGQLLQSETSSSYTRNSTGERTRKTRWDDDGAKDKTSKKSESLGHCLSSKGNGAEKARKTRWDDDGTYKRNIDCPGPQKVNLCNLLPSQGPQDQAQSRMTSTGSNALVRAAQQVLPTTANINSDRRGVEHRNISTFAGILGPRPFTPPGTGVGCLERQLGSVSPYRFHPGNMSPQRIQGNQRTGNSSCHSYQAAEIHRQSSPLRLNSPGYFHEDTSTTGLRRNDREREGEFRYGSVHGRWNVTNGHASPQRFQRSTSYSNLVGESKVELCLGTRYISPNRHANYCQDPVPRGNWQGLPSQFQTRNAPAELSPLRRDIPPCNAEWRHRKNRSPWRSSMSEWKGEPYGTCASALGSSRPFDPSMQEKSPLRSRITSNASCLVTIGAHGSPSRAQVSSAAVGSSQGERKESTRKSEQTPSTRDKSPLSSSVKSGKAESVFSTLPVRSNHVSPRSAPITIADDNAAPNTRR